MTRSALIIGVTGQDGAYLAKHLLGEGYEVHGTSRDAQVSTFANLKKLGIKDSVHLDSLNPVDFRSVLQGLTKTRPDEVYNLSGQSSVGLSFAQPVETLDSIILGTLNLLEGIRFMGLPIRFYNAGSSESFGDVKEPATEKTPFNPRSPYAVAKASAYWLVANYREAYGLLACSGILYNHESPLRPERFVTQKIVATACRIAQGEPRKLKLGNLSIRRDWGWAPEYVEAMARMLKLDIPKDFIIATGQSHSLQEFVEAAFKAVNLDWREHVEIDPALFRPTDLEAGLANPGLAERELGWKALTTMPEVVARMVEARSG